VVTICIVGYSIMTPCSLVAR